MSFLTLYRLYWGGSKIRQRFRLKWLSYIIAFTHWAKLNNLKQAARTINFLTEHGIQSYGILEDILEGLSEKMHAANDEIKAIDQRMGELELVRKYAAAYRHLKPIYDKIQISESGVLVPGLLCRHGGEEREPNCGVHQGPTQRRRNGRTVKDTV